mmetsp:Transcript_41488/g.102381  ORF Transcript_41488/g.102381 Transcript_41488/m.102381 type:complete len:243 (-) Transcript_41488:45-773(-)
MRPGKAPANRTTPGLNSTLPGSESQETARKTIRDSPEGDWDSPGGVREEPSAASEIAVLPPSLGLSCATGVSVRSSVAAPGLPKLLTSASSSPAFFFPPERLLYVRCARAEIFLLGEVSGDSLAEAPREICMVTECSGASHTPASSALPHSVHSPVESASPENPAKPGPGGASESPGPPTGSPGESGALESGREGAAPGNIGLETLTVADSKAPDASRTAGCPPNACQKKSPIPPVCCSLSD